MIRIVFKNLDESEIAKEAVYDRFQGVVDKFPDLSDHRMAFTLSMDNSQFQPGPDLFKVKLVITGKKYGNVVLEKSAMSLYLALTDVADHMLERLNRVGDKKRVKNRTQARKIVKPKPRESDYQAFEDSI